MAAFVGNTAVLSLLGRTGANLNVKTSNGFSPACIGAQNGHNEIIVVLRDAGADLNASTEKGFSPAHMAAQNGHLKILALLKDAGANLDLQNKVTVSDFAATDFDSWG